LFRLAQLHLWQGNLVEAEATIEQGKKEFNLEATPYFFSFIILAEVELALKQGHYERALATANDLLASLNQFGLRSFISDVLYLRGQILGEMGQIEAARNTLLEARLEAEAIGSRRMLWQILFALSQLETDPTKAKQWRKHAQEIVTDIADNISEPELRASFLGLPQVQMVLGITG
jgi:tetratricopeptide (TPR) repeat protein